MRMSDWSSDVCSSDLGAEWKALISRYIETIPLNGDVSCAAMQSMSEPPEAAVSSAMAAKVGVAARLSRSPAPSEAAVPLSRRIAPAARPPVSTSPMPPLDRQTVVYGKRGSARLDLGVLRNNKKKK